MLLFEVEEPTWWIFCWTLGLMGVVGTRRERLLWICRRQTAQSELHCRKEVCCGLSHPNMHITQTPKTQCIYFLKGITAPPSISPAGPGPCPLSQLCRFCIRRSLGRSRLHRASSLFLPHSVKDFLLYQWDTAVLHICALSLTNRREKDIRVQRMGWEALSVMKYNI